MVHHKRLRTFCLFLISVLVISFLPGCASSGMSDVELPTLTPELEADLLAALELYCQENPIDFSVPSQFCDLGRKEDGIRYYGCSENSSGTKEHFLFIPLDVDKAPVSIKVQNQVFSHPSSFAILKVCCFKNLTATLTLGAGDTLNSFPEDMLNSFVAIHNAYESKLYGTLAQEAPAKTEEDVFRDFNTFWLANNGNFFSSPFPYGAYGGYVFYCGETALDIMQPDPPVELVLGGETFKFVDFDYMYAYKDDRIYNIYEIITLVEEGKISQEAISAYAQLHRERYPQYYD